MKVFIKGALTVIGGGSLGGAVKYGMEKVFGK